ncbi:hypothetical protein CGCF415_v012934 [Colletotrichum fructicola]|uniref:Cell wall protein n=1 Tax=Colletotrichum fructicola (strain Nara gc5) TaxID=1213859 RepID=L2FUY5_COLFN|nr:uncharacterized protein CGMCC3_g17598 [Colletotrichum fructicola]KAF4481233.1 hypothetical protein CGGC5_v011630 [Colletotrichum fructicola Nara gc5]KAI8207906.1 hypothetical protein KHU50_008106 [Colletotrichum sp. SAR 10_65]KAI8245934.1 hypothetical protein K4K53_002646 [Colletotrichum sp. SAR 10_77]KAI8274257.1 hypothetical protein K4K60_009899 [Colletotrichum sp. SAR11_57]KAE9566245.1 hypothetical protein CGMCC3_g17598 [Colletotrichum fructicola]
MKFSIPVVLFTAGAVAAPSSVTLNERQLSALTQVLTPVLQGLQSFDVTLNAYTGGPGQELLNVANNVIAGVRAAANAVAPIQPVSEAEAGGFAGLGQQLDIAGYKFIADLNAQVPVFAQSGICPETLNWVTQVGDGVLDLKTAVFSKFPNNGGDANDVEEFRKLFSAVEQRLKECSAPPSADCSAYCGKDHHDWNKGEDKKGEKGEKGKKGAKDDCKKKY